MGPGRAEFRDSKMEVRTSPKTPAQPIFEFRLRIADPRTSTLTQHALATQRSRSSNFGFRISIFELRAQGRRTKCHQYRRTVGFRGDWVETIGEVTPRAKSLTERACKTLGGRGQGVRVRTALEKLPKIALDPRTPAPWRRNWGWGSSVVCPSGLAQEERL